MLSWSEDCRVKNFNFVREILNEKEINTPNENPLSLNLTRSGTKILLRKIKCRRVQIVFLWIY